MVSERGISGNLIVTIRNGKMMRSTYIKELVDRTVEIWNGFEWSEVTPVESGYDAEIINVYVSMDDKIESVDCTPNYHFLMEDGKKLLTTELETNFKLRDWNDPMKKPCNGTIYQIERSVDNIEPIVYCIDEQKSRSFVADYVLVSS